jgi:hypothetical protein
MSHPAAALTAGRRAQADKTIDTIGAMSECSHFTAGLEPTLAEVARVGATLQDEWWVIGSAAIALTGVDIEVLDVDLLVSERDARTLLGGWATPTAVASDQDRFRSVAGEHAGTPIPIQVMGRLEVNVEDAWVPIAPTTRVTIDLSGGTVYTPDPDDLLALLLMFRRPQDLVRAEMLLRRP